MRLLFATLAAATALAVTAAPAPAVTTGAVIHLATAGQESFAPPAITVARGTDLSVTNPTVNRVAHTYIVGNGTSSWSTGAVAPGSLGLVTLPTAGTFTLSRLGGTATAIVTVV